MTSLTNDTRRVAPEDLRQQMQGLPNWVYDEETNDLMRQYRFEDAAGTDRFLSSVDQLAAEVGYAPRCERDDTGVEVHLGGDEITYRDLEFAHLMQGLDERNA